MQQEPVRAEFRGTRLSALGVATIIFPLERAAAAMRGAIRLDRHMLDQMAHQDQIERGVGQVEVFDRAEVNFQAFAFARFQQPSSRSRSLDRPAEAHRLLEHRPSTHPIVEQASHGTIREIGSGKSTASRRERCQVNRKVR